MREIIHAVSDEIKRMFDALGGLNAVCNVHLGAVRLKTQGLREAVLHLSRQIKEKISVLEPGAKLTSATLETHDPAIPLANPL